MWTRVDGRLPISGLRSACRDFTRIRSGHWLAGAGAGVEALWVWLAGGGAGEAWLLALLLDVAAPRQTLRPEPQ